MALAALREVIQRQYPRLRDAAASVDPTLRRPVESAMHALKEYAARLMTAELRKLEPGTYAARDWLDDDGFAVALIPHTLARTTLEALAPGDPVNLEVDVLAKYVERLLGGRAAAPDPGPTSNPEIVTGA